MVLDIMAWHIILFLGFVVLGVFWGLLFFFKKRGDRFANNILGAYTLLFSFELLCKCLRWSGYMSTEAFIHFSLLNAPLWLLYGPLVYLYSRRVITGKGVCRSDAFFLLVVLIFVVLLGPYYILDTESKIFVWKEKALFDHVWLPTYIIWVIMPIMAFYGFLALRHFGPEARSGYRENTWLLWFLAGYFGYVLAFFAFITLTRLGWLNPAYDYFVDIVIVFFIGVLTFFGFVQPEIFEGKRVRQLIPFVKYQKTGLSDMVSMEFKEKLVNLMWQEELFLEPTLRMDDVAKRLKLSRNHTSQVINQHFNLSFFDFVNKYRIEKAKELLTEGRASDSSITQIAYDSGFNNRASFYKAFKKFEGMTPTQFQHQALD